MPSEFETPEQKHVRLQRERAASNGTNVVARVPLPHKEMCVCGRIELAGDIAEEIGGVTHRKDGPCFQTDSVGETQMHLADVIPLTDGKAKEILSKLYPGEPVFVFRAKDILSTFALDRYLEFVEQFNRDSTQAASLYEIIQDFRDWQVANPHKIKLPD